jgi:hypothetical protein
MSAYVVVFCLRILWANVLSWMSLYLSYWLVMLVVLVVIVPLLVFQ